MILDGPTVHMEGYGIRQHFDSPPRHIRVQRSDTPDLWVVINEMEEGTSLWWETRGSEVDNPILWVDPGIYPGLLGVEVSFRDVKRPTFNGQWCLRVGQPIDRHTDRSRVFRVHSWSGWPDLNRRPLVPQTSALPDCATARVRQVRTSAALTGGVVRDQESPPQRGLRP